MILEKYTSSALTLNNIYEVIILGRKVTAIYFTGTGTTEKMVTFIAKVIAKEIRAAYEVFDFTKPQARKGKKTFGREDVVIMGTPVIAGRVPNLLLPYLDTVSGNGAFGIPVVMFGNRSFDDALVELKAIMLKNGFKTIAAGGFGAEHSFSATLGKGRPDSEDMKEAHAFALKIAEKIRSGNEEIVKIRDKEEIGPYYMPRDRHGEHIDIRKVKPKTDMSLCTNCGFCADHCPLGSINPDNAAEVPGICMKCCKCVKLCPVGAKYFDDPGYIYHKEELEEMYGGRRAENSCFLSP